jgi:4-methyl-5(b-hydroxyethyl)-thiazole monophosphate biosynthesis
MFLVDGFEECEALVPLDMLRRADIEVQTVGIETTRVTGAHDITVTADIDEEEVELDDALDMVILPGGPGHQALGKSQLVKDALDFCDENGRFIAAICAAPSILGMLGLLEGKKATCFPGYEDHLLGAEVVTDLVLRDGHFITAKGAGAALEFGFALIAALKGKPKAEQVWQSMQCPNSHSTRHA